MFVTVLREIALIRSRLPQFGPRVARLDKGRNIGELLHISHLDETAAVPHVKPRADQEATGLTRGDVMLYSDRFRQGLLRTMNINGCVLCEMGGGDLECWWCRINWTLRHFLICVMTSPEMC